MPLASDLASHPHPFALPGTPASLGSAAAWTSGLLVVTNCGLASQNWEFGLARL